MTVIGLDDTDSRERGMCTTYVGHRLAARLRDAHGDCVRDCYLVRLNPAVEHKTRGNAAVAVHADVPADEALALATDLVDDLAETDDPDANPGVVVADTEWSDATGLDAVVAFARSAVRDHLTIADAERVAAVAGYETEGWGNGRGRIGALAAVGAVAGWRAGSDPTERADADPAGSPGPAALFADRTFECISYREGDRWGTDREVDHESVFAAADAEYPTVWDTVDHGEDEAVCVPHTPGPVLHGIRGDDPDACRRVADRIESEPVASRETFVTNQGTDAHLRDGTVAGVTDGRAYRVTARVVSAPETKRGGHVHFKVRADETDLACAAFEPTKRFRGRVRALREGDRVTVAGEVSGGTLKLEKFAVRDLATTERVTPECPDCGRRMESAGRDQGYRCRDCGTSADGKVERTVERDLEPGWYEVPPCARRHVARPLVRGGFDAPTHPER